MDTADVRRRVAATIARAKRAAVDRKASVDAAERDYGVFLERTAVPLFRQVANILRADHYRFEVFTPGRSVRLTSETNRDHFIELSLDTTGHAPVVVGHTSYSRAGRVMQSEQPVGSGAVGEISEDDVLTFVLSGLEPLVER